MAPTMATAVITAMMMSFGILSMILGIPSEE
jgi:hypothetical protein